MNRLGRMVDGVGKGLVAGLVGTAAMTVSSTIEQKLRKREASSAPARAAAKVLHIERFSDEGAERRFSDLVHWSFGTGWGVLHGLLRGVGLGPHTAAAAHFSAVWGNSVVMLPSLDVAPPINLWEREEIAIDAWHHMVYALATATCYALLNGKR